MLLLEDRSGAIVAVRPRLRDRLAAQVRSHSVDAELAGGASPEASLALALRAQALTSTTSRRLLADGVQRALTETVDPSAASLATAPLNRAGVIGAACELVELRAALLAPGPVSTQGVAQVQLLLTEGAGPLYRRGADLGGAVRRALDALRLVR